MIISCSDYSISHIFLSFNGNFVVTPIIFSFTYFIFTQFCTLTTFSFFTFLSFGTALINFISLVKIFV